jgi:hypothetical protein
LKKPLTVLKNRSNPEVLAQIEAVDVMMDSMEAYPGRSIAQIYHAFVRTNHLAEGHVSLRGGRKVDLADVTVPVMNIAGKGDLFFAPPQSAYRLGELLPNSPHVRLETAPGGHLGVLTGSRARTTTWKYLEEFLGGVDAEAAGGTPDAQEEAAAGSRPASAAATRVRSAGSTSTSNQGFRRNQEMLRGEGCGSGTTAGSACQLRTVAVTSRPPGACQRCAYRPQATVSSISGIAARRRRRHSGAHSGRGGRSPDGPVPG